MQQHNNTQGGQEKKEQQQLQHRDQRQHEQSHLLRLPVELREQIYGCLLLQEDVPHPFPHVGITSVTHRFPTDALLHIHPRLTYEVVRYYLNVTTWKIMLIHTFNFASADPDLSNLARSAALLYCFNVETSFFCDILPPRDESRAELDRFCNEIRRKASRVCEVLKGATRLRTVKVSWIDLGLTGLWEEKARALQPLRGLSEGGNVSFTIGEISGPEGTDRLAFVNAMEQTLGLGANSEVTRAEGGST